MDFTNLSPTVLALGLLALPILFILESLDAYFTEAGFKDHWAAKLALRLGPLTLGVAFALLMPGQIKVLSESLGGYGFTLDSTGSVVAVGVLVGAHANQLHSWGASQLFGTFVRNRLKLLSSAKK